MEGKGTTGKTGCPSGSAGAGSQAFLPVYGMEFAGMEIKFRVNEDVLTVCGVEMTGENQSHR